MLHFPSECSLSSGRPRFQDEHAVDFGSFLLGFVLVGMFSHSP